MDSGVRVRILNVGQGDAIVGILPGGDRAFVVDVYDSDKVLDFLTEEGIAEVVLFLSHSDHDHTAGAADFIATFSQEGRIVGIFYSRDRLNADARSEYVRLTRAIGEFSRSERRRNPDFLFTEFNTVLNRLPDFAALFPSPASVRVIHPEPADQTSLIGQEINDTAGVLMVECGTANGMFRRILLAADIQLTGISLILDRESNESIRADVLKFPHHGAWPEEWPGISFVNVPKKKLHDFLRSVAPSVVVVSAGFGNPHGHVREEAFALLEDYWRDAGVLAALKCTQFTATCFGNESLPDGGALHHPHCAGDVEISFGSDAGREAIGVATIPENHVARVAEVDASGRAGCRFLPEIAAVVNRE